MYNQLLRILYSVTLILLFSASIIVACQSKPDKATEVGKELKELDNK